ncbi:MAG: hypothetical protein DMG34_06235 [Acidobacteria bacterium]|nr:MAG: hypothetical protein DMG34_06235 [Acidobacteriota bacterium]
MHSPSFEIVTVGGGLGASAFAGAMAKKGVRVLILEKETQFKDRVRGEYIVTWRSGRGEGAGHRNCAAEFVRYSNSVC